MGFCSILSQKLHKIIGFFEKGSCLSVEGWLSGHGGMGALWNLFDQRFDPYCLHVYGYMSTKNLQVRVLLPANFKENDKNLHCEMHRLCSIVLNQFQNHRMIA